MRHEHQTQGLITPKLAPISLVVPKFKSHKFANVKPIDHVFFGIPLMSNTLKCLNVFVSCILTPTRPNGC
jgi:hypothetical protein